MMRWYRWMKKPVVLIVFVLGINTSGYALYRVETSNFSTVSPGTVYRSGQMDEAQWTDYIQKYAIRSVLNLRGEHRAASWYQEEVRAADKLGVTHYDVKISANREVDNGALDTILAIMRQAPKPLLIHCQAGSSAPRKRHVSCRFSMAIFLTCSAKPGRWIAAFGAMWTVRPITHT